MYVDEKFYRHPGAALLATPNAGELLSAPVRGGMLYVFQKVGDFIPAHTHTDGMGHTTFIMQGRIRLTQVGHEDLVYEAPAIVVPADGVEHSFIGETEGAVAVNINTKSIF
jgi:quercetin dioxygenase-like cupin family protein